MTDEKTSVLNPQKKEFSLTPSGNFFIVCDLNTNAAFGPFDTQREAQYRAAEVAASVRGVKPVGVFKYIGGVTSEHKPLFWTDAAE